MYSGGDSGAKTSEQNITKGIVSLIFLGIIFWYFWGGGLEIQTGQKLDEIKKQVSADFVQQYQIAKQQGDKIQICVQAGLVSAGYLQEHNSSEYSKWKAIESEDCAKAGMPRNN